MYLRQRLHELFFLPSPPNSNFFFTPLRKTFLIMIYPFPTRNSSQPRRGGGGGRPRLKGFVGIVTSRSYSILLEKAELQVQLSLVEFSDY